MKNKRYISFIIITLLFGFLGISCVYAVTGSGTKKTITITGTNQPSNDISFCGDSKTGNGRPAYLPTYKYNAKDPNFSNISQTSYCLQRGRPGPDGSTWSYVALDNFDISTCKSSSDNYQCGLAEIMCHTMDISAGSDGNFTANENSRYSYSSVATALRMWVAYDHSSIHDGDGIRDNTGDGDYYYSNTDVYEKSAKYYLDNGGEIKQCPKSCSAGDSSYGVFCYQNASSDEQKHIQGAIELVSAAKSGLSCLDNLTNTITGQSGDGEGGNDGTLEGKVNPGKPGIKTDFHPENKTVDVTVRFNTIKVGSKTLTKEEIEKIQVDWCKEDSPDCNVVVKVFDSRGVELQPVGGKIPNECKKNYCEIKYKYEELCKKTTTETEDQYITIKVTTYVEKSNSGASALNALIKNYVKVNGDVSQQFINFDIQGLNDLKNGKLTQGSGNGSTDETTETTKKSVFTTKSSVVCPCDDDKRCGDFEIVNTLPEKCTDYGQFNRGLYDTYDEGVLEEPYMNCIMNACNVSQRNQYDFSKEYKVDVGVCRIFCREEIEFYLANKTRVYAGMQFKYEIDRLLGTKRKLGNGSSLTSMVLQKRECASEIYYDHRNPLYNYSTSESRYDSYIKQGYDTWQKMYGQAVKEMIEAWDNWKYYETLHKNEGWGNSCNPKLNHADTEYCYSSGSSCGSTCGTTATYPGFDYVYTWPTTGSPQYTKTDFNNVSINDRSKETNDKVKFGINNGPDTPSDQDGKFNQSNGCNSVDCNCKIVDGQQVCDSKGVAGSGTCAKGEKGKNKCKVKDQESSNWTAFKNAVDNVTQLIYDLENCNLYIKNELKLYYNDSNLVDFSGYTGRPKYQGKVLKYAFGSGESAKNTKDYILELANCKNEKECISLELEYADKKYGEATVFGKQVEVIEAQEETLKGQQKDTHYCTNASEDEKKSGDSYVTDCYKKVGNKFNDDNDSTNFTKTNLLGKHDLITCKGYDTNAKCEIKKDVVELPINDFAKFIVVSEADFWQPKKYVTEAYTGNVYESGSNYSSSSAASLGDYVFPVSMDKESGGATGAYNVKHKYSYVGYALSKAQLLNEKYYEFTCQYEVYNITNLYDCDISTDLTNCKNQCYEIRDGVPIIREAGGNPDRCAAWNNRNSDSKGYGFIYRNVNLGNLFPTNRDIGTNWLSHNDAKNAIEATADDMYGDNEKYLEYSYVLTNDAIKKIRTYNNDRNGAGGYVDNTLIGCDITNDGFYNCRSSFLDLFRDNSNSFGIKVNKSDGQQGS